jgi:thiosulfate/3-mercaptopyruvate sulfurtransferase
MHTPLIEADELLSLMASGATPLVLDASFELGKPESGKAQFAQEHIPGSLHADLDDDLSDHGQPPSAGRHPLPSREAFASRLVDWGLNPGQPVVVLDRQGANYCGRLWWMLKWCGHEPVAVLNGGIQAWKAAGGPVTADPTPSPTPGGFVLGPSLVRALETAELQRALGSPEQTVIDARATPRYRGEVEPLDPVAGHIPGALNRPFGDNIGPDGRFKPAAQLKQEFLELLGGRDPAGVVHQCGSGVSALPNLLAMEIAGLGRSALYPGSWSAWCNTPGTPRARG